MQSARRVTLSLILILFALVGTGVAATQNAIVYGTVYDHAGSPLPSVTVIMENAALGFTRVTTTGSDGSYTFAEIPPAQNYQLTAILGGKKIDIRVGITVNVGDERVILPPLQQQQPAAAAAAAPAEPVAKRMDKTAAVSNENVSTAISGVITGDQLHSLPLYNRNFLALGTLTPNTHDTDAANELRGASFSVAGARPNQNNFLLDGTDNVAASSNQAVPFQVNDSIQEFRVISSTASAEYGRNLGGVVNVVTRRAGNDFHGSVFGYFGNDALNADNPLSVYNGTSFDRAAAYAGPTNAAPFGGPGFPAAANYNEYVATAAAHGFCTDSIGVAGTTVPCSIGGVASGATGANTLFNPQAILLAHNDFKQPFDSKQFGVNAGKALIKDKVFLFGSYEGTRIDNPTPIFERVPSTFDRTPNILGPGGARAIPVGTAYNFNPATSANYAVAANIMSLYPAANVIGVPDALEFYNGLAPNYTNVHNALGRMDWMKSKDTSMTFRYVIQSLNQLHDDTLPEQPQYAGNGAIRDALNHNVNVSMVHNFSTRVVNEGRFSFTRFRVTETPQDGGVPTFLLSGIDPQYSGEQNAFGGTAPCGNCFGAISGWADKFWSGGTPNTVGLPTLDGLFPMARIGAPLNAPGNRLDNTWLGADTFSILSGKHSLKIGGEFRILRNNIGNAGLARGFVVASNIGEFTSDSTTCNSGCTAAATAQSFTAPSFDYAVRQPSPYDMNFHSWTGGVFVQDTIRLHKRFTVNLGMRYEYFSVPYEENNLLWNFDPVANGLVQAGTTDVVSPYGQPCGSPVVYANMYQEFANTRDWNCSNSGTSYYMRKDKNNIAPRAGFAWDLFGNGKTIIRSGVGIYYDQEPISYVAQLGYNRPTPYVADNPSLMYGQNLFVTQCSSVCATGNSMLDPANIVNAGLQGRVSAASMGALYSRDYAHSDTPMSTQVSASWQQSITGKVALEVGYVGASARHLPVVYNSGFENEWFNIGGGGLNIIEPFPIFTMTNRGGASYHSLMTRVRAADWHGLHINGAYYWSKSIDNASNSIFPTVGSTLFNDLFTQLDGRGNITPICLLFSGFVLPSGSCIVTGQGGGTPIQSALTTTGAGAVYTSPYQIPQAPVGLAFLANDRGRSDFDSTHRVVFDYVWDVPGPKSSKLWSGWQLSGIFTAQSGQPFTIFAGPVAGEVDQRVNVTGPVTITSDPNAMIGTTNLVLAGNTTDGCAKTTGSPFIGSGSFWNGTGGTPCIGNSVRNAFTGPSFINMNAALQKSLQVFGEGKTLTIRTEVYNLFNRANYYNPISAFSVDGLTVNPDFGKVKSAHDPRQIQFAARFNW